LWLITSTSTLEETLNRLVTTLSPLAHQLNYTISFFDIPSHNSSKHISVYQKSAGFEPAPITSGDSESFKLLAGTGKAAFGKELIVAPTGMYGTRFLPSHQNGNSADGQPTPIRDICGD
jgi:hypothetical protein